MAELFLKIVGMSVSASWLILAVLVFRLVFRRAPRWLHVLLWGLVAVRLLCPFSVESAVSLLPEALGNGGLVEEWTDGYVGDVWMIHDNSPYYDAAVSNGREPVSDGEGHYYVVAADDRLGEPPTVKNTIVPVLAGVWAAGAAALLAYTAVSYWRLRRRVRTAVLLRERVFQCETVSSPFVMGILRPQIYLPFAVEPRDLEYVLAHEEAHIRRRDHWWKPLGFLLLTFHWFNPLMWAAYVLLCWDIELACDEKVIKVLGDGQRADYSQALLSCSVPRHMIAACPLAFGEVGVKERVKSVLNYRKPAFWVVAVSVIACAVVAVCFLTNPKQKLPDLEQTWTTLSSEGEDYDVGLFGLSRKRLIDAWGEPDGTLSGFYGDFWEVEGQGKIIVYYDSDGNVQEIKLTSMEDDLIPTVEADTPVQWVYSPLMSATWHAAFHFTFDMEYSHIEATCDHGRLWDFDAAGQPREQSLRFEAGSPVCWSPSEGDSLTGTTEQTTVHFTVYDGGEILYTGDLEISSTGMVKTGTSYQACLTGDDLLTLKQAPVNAGGIVSLSDSASMVSWSDLNHNRVNELVFVREKHPGQLYELVVRENGETIWSMEASPAHVGWNTILLYSEGGQEYLVQYQPAMFQGMGNYTCTVFSLEGGRQTVKQELSVDFEVQPGDPVSVKETPEMKQFAQAVNLLLRNSVVLLSTEQGILVDEYTQASALPQLYPVRFNPDEIQAAIDGREPGEPLTASAVRFPEAPVELLFSSGAGAWGTVLTLNPDGSFTGSYSDAEMGLNDPEYPHGTCYVCDFRGRFTDIRQISDNAFSMRLESVTSSRHQGKTWIKNQIRYIASGPYGLTGGEDFLLYAPGTPGDDLPADCRDWWPDAWLWRNGEVEALDGWALCNVDAGHGFFQHETISEPLPDNALTEEEIAQVNEAFFPEVRDKQGNPIGVNPWSCFFTSYYDDVRKLDFQEFLWYFPGDGSKVSGAEFEALRSVDVWPFQQVETLEKMPVPIQKKSSRLINEVLSEYAGITLDDLNTSKVPYLVEYDAYYTYTSDYGPGMFFCTRGKVDGDTVRLYHDYDEGMIVLTLRKEGNQYRVVSHQKIEG